MTPVADGITTAPSMEMPRYKSHKTVHALKIGEIRQSPADEVHPGGSWEIVPAEKVFAPIIVTHDYVTKHSPQAGGYYVLYEDGYHSYSPAEPFEDGYTLLRPEQRRMDPLFTVHILSSEGIDAAHRVACAFDNLLSELRAVCMENTREFSIVKTKLEEACFFAKKVVAIDTRNQAGFVGAGIAGNAPGAFKEPA